MIRIKRDTGMLGVLGTIQVHVNDEEVTSIKANKSVELELPAEEATIRATQFGGLSNELVVKDGQTIKITSSIWNYLSFIFAVVAVAINSAFVPFNYRIWGFFLIIATILAIGYFKNLLKLTISDP